MAVAHEAVVEHFARDRAATVVPMKLFTMFSSRERAIDEMRARAPELRAILDRIAGCQEWGVRITRADSAASPAPKGPAITSGAAFLAAKKQVRDQARESVRIATDAAEDALDRLVKVARSVRRQPVPEGAQRPPLVDAAFLVPIDARARFTAAVKRAARDCRAAGAEVALTGPWPAYNFVRDKGGA